MNKEKKKQSVTQKIKFKALLLFPPLMLCVCGVGVAFVHSISDFSFGIPSFIQWTFVGSAIWLLLCVWFILCDDYKTRNNI